MNTLDFHLGEFVVCSSCLRLRVTDGEMITSKLDVPAIYLFIRNNAAQYWVLFVVLCSFLFCYFVSVISGILLALFFVLGVIACNALCTNYSIDLLTFFEVKNYSNTLAVHTNLGCGVCGDSQCKRQKAVKDNQPWLGLNVPRDVDQAIQDLFNKILNEFVTSWHGNFTKDEAFILELRRCLRYASSILLKRLLQVDIGEVITDRLVTTGLRHVNDFLYISKIASQDNISIEAAAVKYLNKRLHPAVHSRNSEIQYLRCLCDLLTNHLVMISQLKSLCFKALIKELLAGWVLLPTTDILCDPFCINSLVLLALSHEPLTEYPNNTANPVQFLHRFVMPNKDFASRKSALHSSLSSILKDQKLLYTFMQFLKKEGVVHILQFCLDVEEFSKKILNPELSQDESKSLHKEATELFSSYFKHDSPNNIHFPKHIVQQMEQVLEGGAANISRLRTNPALFKAYEIAYSMLEETYCPLFYLSDDFFPLLCGERQVAKFAKGVSSPLQPGSPNKARVTKKSEPGTVGKLSSKFQKLLQFQAVEGKAYFADTPLDIAETVCTEDLQVEVQPESMYRDMSTWQVSVPSVSTRQDSNSKPYPVFNISVIDVGTKDNLGQSVKVKWSVERKYNDFYILQAKLAEFHGEFEDGLQLPPKIGMFSPRGSEFLESRRQLFEEYLQKLLQNPNLRGSDLLYFFLHSSVEFSSCLSAQDGFGKILRKSVEPIKLRKERGQHLENFLNVFLSSTEGVKKSGKYEWQDIGLEPKRKKRDITKSMFNNNFQPYLNEKPEGEMQKEALMLLGPWDCILYTMSKLMGASPQVMQITVTFKNLLGSSPDSVIKGIITKKLESLLVPGRVSHLVRLLQDALFSSNYKPGKQSPKILEEKILLEIKRETNNLLLRWFLPNFCQGVEKIVKTLQHPILNKHLCYCLLDEVVRVLFPELATSS